LKIRWWLGVLSVLTLLVGCAWLASKRGQDTLDTVGGVATGVATVAPAAGPAGVVVATIAGLVAAAAGGLAEYGRRRASGALTATVAGLEAGLVEVPPALKAQLVSRLVEHQEKAKVRPLVQKTLRRVKAANGKAT